MNPKEIIVAKARLRHASAPLADSGVAARVAAEPLRQAVKPGQRIAIAVGSRGIANIAVIVKAVVDFLRELGTLPFIVPAMGSHGGASGEGQALLLREYGISEQTMGVPVLSSMEVVPVGEVSHPVTFPVYMDKHAHAVDGIVVINRVKAHTDFHGRHESGIVKMLVIGLGKHRQAALMHRYGADGLRDFIPLAAQAVLDTGKILGGVAIIEDGYERTSAISFASADDFFEVDAAMLLRSKGLMAKLPFEAVDALIVDRLGKDISGSGMDTNVIGRVRIAGQPDTLPHCKKIAVLDITPASHGNAAGVGLADVTTRRLADKIDWQATNENTITSGFLERGFLPIVAKDDRTAIEIATAGVYADGQIRLARIRDTLHLDEVYLTKPLMDELLAKGGGEQVGGYEVLAFDGGELGEF